MNKIVSLYIKYGRKYVINLRENDLVDIFAMYLKAWIAEKKRVFCGKLTGVKEAARKIIVIEQPAERTVYTGNKDKNENFQSKEIYIAEVERGYLFGGCNLIFQKGKLLNDLLYNDAEERINCIWSPVVKNWGGGEYFVKCIKR